MKKGHEIMRIWVGTFTLLITLLSLVACGSEADRLYRRAKDAADEEGDHITALELLDRAIELEPEDGRLQRRRGEWLRELERYDEALAAFDTAVSVENPSESSYKKAISLCLSLDRLDEAEQWIQRAEANLSDSDDREEIEEFIQQLEQRRAEQSQTQEVEPESTDQSP